MVQFARTHAAALLASALILASPSVRADSKDGIVKTRSAYSMSETIARLRKDIADKKIMFFDEIDQAKLAADAGITIRPSTLLVFGNPPLGTLVPGLESDGRARLAGAAPRGRGR